MNKNEILSSAMATDEMNKLVARKNEIASLIEEKRATFEKSDVETRDALLKDVEELEKEAKGIDTQVQELEELRSTLANQEERMGLMGNVSPTKVEERKNVEDEFDTKEYRHAWVDYIKTGSKEALKQLRAGVYTGLSNVPVPTIFQSYVETAWEKFGKFSRYVTKSFVKGWLSIPTEASADGAVVHDEGGDAPNEEAITLGLIEIKPAMIKKWISLTDEIMAMTDDEFMRYIADELVYRVVLKLDEGIIKGALDTNGKGVVGILGNTNTNAVSSELSFNVVNEALATLNTFDNILVAMNQKTFFKNFMGLTDLQGRPIYQVATDNAGKPRYFVGGLPVEFTNALPAYDSANAGDAYIVVGNFAGYRLNLPNGDGVDTMVDPYTLATEDKVRMIGKIYAGGNVAKLGHFAEIKVPASVQS